MEFVVFLKITTQKYKKCKLEKFNNFLFIIIFTV